MDMRISPLNIKILLESNPLKSRNLSTEIGRRTVGRGWGGLVGQQEGVGKGRGSVGVSRDW